MSSPRKPTRTNRRTDDSKPTDSSPDASPYSPRPQSILQTVSDWLEHRTVTLGLAALLTIWYGLQLIVAIQYGLQTAEWWFYFKATPSPGWLFAPISHNLRSVSHLQNNVFALLVAGSVIEPYLSWRQYFRLFAALAFVSIVIPAVGSALVLTGPWLVAGASGGIYGLWAFLGMSRRQALLHIDGFDQFAEGVIILIGLCLLVIVPVADLLSGGAANMVAHIAGILLGYALGYQENPGRVALRHRLSRYGS